MFTKNLILICFLIFVPYAICNFEIKKTSDDEEIFVATHDWQVVKKGQPIPKGLHVRINFATGVTEAKLLDEKSKKEKTELIEVIKDNQPDDDELLNADILEIKDLEPLGVDEITEVIDKYRKLEKPKKEKTIARKLQPHKDAESLQDLFSIYKKEMKRENINVSAVLSILEDFDQLAHQIDNGLEFVKLDGLNQIIYTNINSSDRSIKKETLKLFGSLLQNNYEVQKQAFETGTLNILLRALSLEESAEVKGRTVHALSCFLRGYPLAQLRFIENGGLSVILKIFEKEPNKLQIKLVTLISDLITENIEQKENPKEDESSVLQSTNLRDLLFEQGWCNFLDQLLHSLVVTDLENHDSIEKSLQSMHVMADKCASMFNKEILAQLQGRYKSLAFNEMKISDDIYTAQLYTTMHNICRDILRKKLVKTEL